MTQATDTDIREIKTAYLQVGEAIDTLVKATEANTKAIGDLTLEMRLGFANADKKMDVGFSDIKGEIKQVEAKLEGKIDTVNARLTNLETDTKNFMGLAEKLGELKNWKQIAFYLFTAVVSGAISLRERCANGGAVGWFVRGGSNR